MSLPMCIHSSTTSYYTPLRTKTYQTQKEPRHPYAGDGVPCYGDLTLQEVDHQRRETAHSGDGSGHVHEGHPIREDSDDQDNSRDDRDGEKNGDHLWLLS